MKVIIKNLQYFYVLLTLGAGIFLGIWQIRPPPADESCAAFQRMMSNVERLTLKPHPSGSAEIELVRAKIIAEIEEMGLTPIIHKAAFTHAEATAAHIKILGRSYVLPPRFFPAPGRSPGGTLPLQNILVKLPGYNSKSGIMFVAHYDSWMNSPGAADAMVGVCAMLEVMRIFTNKKAIPGSAALANNLYFLFTEGEEFGALGALAFVKDHPELRDRIDMVVNLEARGTRGGLLVFETSPEASSVLRLFRRVSPRPIGFSFAALIYERMPVRTDFTFFSEFGFNGINLVILEGAEYYHTPNDTYENLNRATAWHYLSTVRALADYAANNSLERLREPSTNVVFFPFLPGILVILSFRLAYILCAIACLAAFALIFFRLKYKRLMASFSTSLLLTLVLFSIISAIFIHPASYLFWLPLLAVSVSVFLQKWPLAHQIVRLFSGVTALLLWVPLVYLVWAVLQG